MGVLSVSGIRDDPGGGKRGGQSPLDHGAGEVSLGGKAALVGDTGRLAAFPVIRPGLGQVELTVGQGVIVGGGVGGKHPDLAVFGPPGRAGVLALHSG